METWAGIWTVIPLAAKNTEPSFLQSEFSEYFLNKGKEYNPCSRITKRYCLLRQQKLGGNSRPVFVEQISIYQSLRNCL